MVLFWGLTVPRAKLEQAFEVRPDCQNGKRGLFFGSDPAAPGIPKSALKSAYSNIMVG